MPNPTPRSSGDPSVDGEAFENQAIDDSQKMLTQEQVNSVIGKTRAEERAKYPNYDEYKKAYEELKEIKESQQTELEKAMSKNAELESELNSYKVASLKSEVSSATGIPVEVINGETREEMEACAEALKKFFPDNGKPVVPSDGFAPAQTHQKTSKELFVEALSDF